MAVPARVLLASVPAGEAELARRTLPDAFVTPLPPSPALARAHPAVEVLAVASHDRVEPATLAAWPRLGAVVTRSAGFDHLPLAWLRGAGVTACCLRGYATPSVVEHALALILALVRRLPEAAALTQGAEPTWDRTRVPPRDLQAETVGILGTGRIGGGLARRLAAMEVTVLGHDIAPDSELAEVAGFRYARDLEDLFRRATVLSLHVPLTDATERMIDAERLLLMPRGALLVNTARGRIVDQEAVRSALDDGQLAGYAADVLPGEPTPSDLSRFQGDPRVLITPHTAAYDPRALAARYSATATVVNAILNGDNATITRHLAED